MAIEERPTDGFAVWAAKSDFNPGRFHGSHTAATLAPYVPGQTAVDGWSRPLFDRLQETHAAVQLEADPARRAGMRREIQEILWGDVPQVAPSRAATC